MFLRMRVTDGAAREVISLEDCPLFREPLAAEFDRDRQQDMKLWIEQGSANAHRIAGIGI